MEPNSSDRPNVICFISDDTDFSMLGFTGGKALTPTLDHLAADGVQCTSFYASSPVCTPSRYTYLTGRYAGRCPAFSDKFPPGEPYNITWNTDLLPEKERCLGRLLQQGGYRTGYVGKWHAGPDNKSLGVDFFQGAEDPADPRVDKLLKRRQQVWVDQVRRNGFDYAASITFANTDNDTVRKLHVHNLEWTARGALDFLESSSRRKEPFFLYVATTTIHGPSHINSLNADPRLTSAGYLNDHVGCMPARRSVFERLEAGGMPVNHRTAGALWMDDLVATVLARVRQLGIEDDTVVIYSTDHGSFDGKATLCQGGVHIPFAMKWPGRIPAGSRCDALIQNIDFVPTLLEACGVKPADEQFDGHSVLNLLMDEKLSGDRDDLYYEFGYMRAVATRKWKYIATRLPPRLIDAMRRGEVSEATGPVGRPGSAEIFQARRYPHYWEPDQLYDLENDSGEQRNLACNLEYAAVLDEMRARLRKYLATFDRPFNLEQVDPFIGSARYKELAAASERFDPNTWEWYRCGWY